MSVPKPERIVGDWGTSRLRLFRLEGDRIVDRIEGPGIGNAEAPPATVLADTLAPWRPLARTVGVTLCGMVGSRNGLVEIDYVETPADAGGWAGAAYRGEHDGVAVTIAAGLACRRSDGAPDVMRGEETQLFGAMAVDPALAEGSHLVALPGTHGKWARIDGGRVIDFRTYFTGELFGLLSERSTLMRAGDDPSGEAEGFATGLRRIAADRDPLGNLFEARAAQLRDGRTAGWAAGFLSGVLIGAEAALAAQERSVVLVGAPALVERYTAALAAFGVVTRPLDGDACAIAGLTQLAMKLEGTR